MPSGGPGLLSRHWHQSLGPVGVRGLALALGFALQLLLARVLGPAGYGIYSLAFSALLLIIIVALQGHDMGAMRIAAPLIGSGARRIDGYRAAVSKRIWVVGGLIALGVLLLALLAGRTNDAFWQVMMLMALSVPFVARSRFSQGILRAAGKPTQAYLPEGVLPPLLMIPAIAILAYSVELSVAAAGCVFLFAAVANWLLAGALERGIVSAPADRAGRSAAGDRADWWRITVPMYLSALLEAANDKVVFLLLGAMLGEYAAGLYAAASRLTIVAGMIGSTLYLSHASRIAVLYSRNGPADLAAEVGRVTRLVTALTLVVCIPLMIWPESFLGLFGSRFTTVVAPFRILVLAAFINVAMGPVGLLLNMSAFERTHTRILAAALALSALSGVALIAAWGATGAALAVLLSTVFWNAAMLAFVYRRIGFIPLLARQPTPSADLAGTP